MKYAKVAESPSYFFSSIPFILTLASLILSDVERELKTKPRREVRLRAATPTSTETLPRSLPHTSPSGRAPAFLGENNAFRSLDRIYIGKDVITASDVNVPHPLPRFINDRATIAWSQGKIAGEPE